MRPTLHNLQALRGVACLMVFGMHLAVWESHYGISRPLLSPVLWFGYAGVDLFFVLSGFLIAHTQASAIGNPAKLPGYLFRRAWRIYPTFWVMMLLAVVAFEATGAAPPAADGDRLGRWTTWLTLWPPNAPNLYVPVAWTLPYELLFYAAFGLLVLLPRWAAPWLLVGWAAAVGLVAATTGWLHLSSFAVVRHAVNPHVWEFLLGCGIAAVIREGFTRFGRLSVAFGIAWAAAWVPAFNTAATPYQMGMDPLLRVFVFGPAGALIVYGMVAVERCGGWVFPRRLQRIGDASYSIYLWHAPVGILLHDWTAKWWDHKLLPHLGWLAMMTAVAVCGGLLLHRWVEKPLLGLFTRKRREEERPVVVAARVGGIRHELVPAPRGRGEEFASSPRP